jgi:Fe-S-cluster-containing dehydrogenase component/DMSO reductase anchor subunit
MEQPHTLIDLNRANDASAVEIFARQQDAASQWSRDKTTGTYRSLIPTQLPAPGEQYAFEVNLDKCSACKSCVSACHHMNGLSDEESWRRVHQWFGENQGEQWVQTVTSACHHCVNPECMHGCPVGAYEKHPITGIVKHLDDQCIGCEYCIWKCPYEVPRYHESYGIVRKCDMCSERLSNQLEPACVQACPHDAIQIKIADQEKLTHNAKPRMSGKRLYPGAPDSSITTPSSTYYSKRSLRKTRWSKADSHPPQNKPHWPLVWMLILTQWGVGILTSHFIRTAASESIQTPLYGTAFWMGTLLIFTGLLCSFFHLGQPTKSWRFFLGLRTSWLSREILMFNTLAACLCIASLDALVNIIPVHFKSSIAITIVLCGWLSVFTSAMIYHDTQRPEWSIHRTGSQFMESLLSGVLACSFIASFINNNANSKLPLYTTFVITLFMLLTKSIKITSTRNAANHQGSHRLKGVLIGSAMLLFAFAVGTIHQMPWLTGTAAGLSTGCLFLLDLVGRRDFFLQTKSPMTKPLEEGNNS